MKKEIKKILEEIEAETVSDKSRISLYISKAVFRDFQKSCRNVSASRIAEKLMRWYSEDSKRAPQGE